MNKFLSSFLYRGTAFAFFHVSGNFAFRSDSSKMIVRDTGIVKRCINIVRSTCLFWVKWFYYWRDFIDVKRIYSGTALAWKSKCIIDWITDWSEKVKLNICKKGWYCWNHFIVKKYGLRLSSAFLELH